MNEKEYQVFKQIKNLFNSKCNNNCNDCKFDVLCETPIKYWDFGKIENDFIITETEYNILKNFGEEYKNCYLVREYRANTLVLFRNKPLKKYQAYNKDKNAVLVEYYATDNFYKDLPYFKHLFNVIKNTDELPRKVIDYIRDYEEYYGINE